MVANALSYFSYVQCYYVTCKSFINLRRACAARVTVLGLCVCVSVCLCVCVSVRVSVTQHLTFHVFIRATNGTNLLGGG